MYSRQHNFTCRRKKNAPSNRHDTLATRNAFGEEKHRVKLTQKPQINTHKSTVEPLFLLQTASFAKLHQHLWEKSCCLPRVAGQQKCFFVGYSPGRTPSASRRQGWTESEKSFPWSTTVMRLTVHNRQMAGEKLWRVSKRLPSSSGNVILLTLRLTSPRRPPPQQCHRTMTNVRFDNMSLLGK